MVSIIRLKPSGPEPPGVETLGEFFSWESRLAGHRTLAEVRDAAGHANVSITSTYLHVAIDDETVGNLFEFGE